MSASRHHLRTQKKCNKKDQHKQKHVDHHANKDSGHRCMCGYAKCGEVRDGFKGTGHVYDRRPIDLKKPKPCDEWDEFFNSVMRNLHTPEDVVERVRGAGVGCRFDVCAHHFTEEVVQQHWNNNSMRKMWGKRFDHKDARCILHLPLDKRDRDGQGRHFTNANHPMIDAANLMIALNSDGGERMSS